MRRQFLGPALRGAMLIAIAASIAACGVKGPLRPPPKSAPAAAAPATSNPATPPATTSPALPPPSIPAAK